MATLRHYVDGGFYLHRGYPITKKGAPDEMFHTTIEVLPRAEQFFAAVGFKDGTLLSKEIFYSLLLDGDISSPSIQKKRPTIYDIPQEVFYFAEGLSEEHAVVTLLQQYHSSARYLIDFYKLLKASRPDKEPSVLASFLCLARHARQAAYDRKYNKS